MPPTMLLCHPHQSLSLPPPPHSVVAQGGASSLPPAMVGALLGVGSMAGMVGRVMTRAPKYSLFDPAKEMVGTGVEVLVLVC